MKYLYYPHYNNEGGVPEDVRLIAKGLLKDEDFVITLISDLKRLQNNDKLILIGVNNFRNIFAMLICLLKGCSFTVIPFCQVNRFLDYYNPFINRQIPIVNGAGKLEESVTGNSGRVSFKSRLRRRIWRQTFGYLLLAKSSQIIVFSHNEKREINDIYPYNKFNFAFGKFTINSDEIYCSNEKVLISENKKILVWSRLDYFYKGLDIAINYILEYNEKNLEKVDLFLVGPDYEAGRKQITDNNDLTENIHIITDQKRKQGDKQAINDCDAMLLLSRWDGMPRALREAYALDKAIISSPQANFDLFDDGENVFTVDNYNDFEKALNSIIYHSKKIKIPNKHDTIFTIEGRA